MAKKRRKRKKRHLRLWVKAVLVLIIVFIVFCPYMLFEMEVEKWSNKSEPVKNIFINKKKEEEQKKQQEEKERQEKYQACLNEEYNDSDDSEELVSKVNEVTAYLNKYRTSVKYQDVKTKFVYNYNAKGIYYAASTIKMLDAIYIYEKSAEGKLSLDEEIEYTSQYKWGASTIIGKMKFGTKIKLRDLVKYAIIYSDNSAHIMLLKYIGKANLRDFGKSLGATYTLDSDYFGQINVDDAIIYLNELNKYISTDTADAKELKWYFVDSEQKYLNFKAEGIEAAQKYGEYDPYYHENGIVYAQNPYLVSILTTEGNKESIIRGINSKIYELHKTFYEQRENRCKQILEIEKEEN